jgi:MATE family multidrug resistance protein
MVGNGTVMGVEPLIAQALGGGEHDEARASLWQGMWLAGALALPLFALAAASAWLLEPAGIEAETAHQATLYLYARIPSILAFVCYTAARAYLQARSMTRPLELSALVANALNLPLNWLLVFGDAGLVRLGLPAIGMPAFGVVGAGITSTAVMFLQLAVVLFALRALPHSPVRRGPNRRLIAKALRVGTPIGLQRIAEFGIFSITGVLMAKISTRAVAAHQIAMTYASLTFMVPLGISAAASVRVGHAVGSGERAGVRRSGAIAFLAAGVFMASVALVMITWPRQLAALLTNQEPVIAAAGELLVIAAVFQISDGMQVVGAGALRGMGDTRVVLYLNLAALYLLGMPAGLVLAFVVGMGARGLWWGLCLSLTFVALALAVRFVRLSARGVERL